MMKYDYGKLKTSLRYWMLGRGYNTALKAMEVGVRHHTGFRKDGVTPEFQHQVEQASYARTMISAMSHPEETLATIFLHDVVEDPGGPEMKKGLLSTVREDFGDVIADAVWLMTNQYDSGVKKDKSMYYLAISQKSHRQYS